MKTIGLVLNKQKYQVGPVVEKIYHWLKERSVQVLLSDECAEVLGQPQNGYPLTELAELADLIIVWGGDGTILNCARVAAPLETPLYGVNAGRLGFLTEVDIPDLLPGLERLLAGEYTIEERMMLEVKVYRDNKLIKSTIGLNDAVISRGTFSRMIKLKIAVNGSFVNSYHADGVIVASPTGSTAYSLSAGGPLIDPNIKLMLITPICPHKLSIRPLAIAADSVVTVEIQTTGEKMLTLDGQYGYSLKKHDVVEVQRAQFNAKFIRTQDNGFYEVLRKKLEEWNYSDV